MKCQCCVFLYVHSCTFVPVCYIGIERERRKLVGIFNLWSCLFLYVVFSTLFREYIGREGERNRLLGIDDVPSCLCVSVCTFLYLV